MKTDNGKRKIMKDRKYPSPEEISKYQNFDRVYSDYSVVKKLLLKKTILWTGASVCAVGIAGLAYFYSGKSALKNTAPAQETSKKIEAFVTPPIPGKETPYSIYRISAKNGGVINHSTGSSIVIPANAFHHVNGEQVSDSIDIKYREFQNPLDIFLSGIPMQYDSAGLVRTLESAGMLEIRALDKGQYLTLNEQKQIDIKMAASSLDPRFNVYELDTSHRNWIYKGKGTIESPIAIGPERTQTPSHKITTREMAVVEGNAIKPVMADPQKFSFKLNFDKNEFSELAPYNNVMFEVTDNNFKPAYYKINWKRISLHSCETPGDYIVELSKADTTISVKARPVFDKENYEAAVKKFEEHVNSINKQTEAKDLEDQKTINQVNKELGSYNSRKLVETAVGMAGMMAGFRGLSVRTLGYHNFDYPIPPYLAYAYKIIRVSGQQNIRNKTYSDIYLVEKGKNTVFRFSNGEPVRCNPDAEKLMWTMTDNNQIAFFRITDYKKLINAGENTIEPVLAKNQEQAFKEIREFSL